MTNRSGSPASPTSTTTGGTRCAASSTAPTPSDPRSLPGRQDEWHDVLSERDVRLLPNPPIELPGGLEDTRN